MVSQEMTSNFIRLDLYVNSTLTWIGDAELGSVECTSIVMRRAPEGQSSGNQGYM